MLQLPARICWRTAGIAAADRRFRVAAKRTGTALRAHAIGPAERPTNVAALDRLFTGI